MCLELFFFKFPFMKKVIKILFLFKNPDIFKKCPPIKNNAKNIMTIMMTMISHKTIISCTIFFFFLEATRSTSEGFFFAYFYFSKKKNGETTPISLCIYLQTRSLNSMFCIVQQEKWYMTKNIKIYFFTCLHPIVLFFIFGKYIIEY